MYCCIIRPIPKMITRYFLLSFTTLFVVSCGSAKLLEQETTLRRSCEDRVLQLTSELQYMQQRMGEQNATFEQVTSTLDNRTDAFVELENKYNKLDILHKQLQKNSAEEAQKLNADLRQLSGQLQEAQAKLGKISLSASEHRRKLQEVLDQCLFVLQQFSAEEFTSGMEDDAAVISVMENLLFSSGGSDQIDRRGKEALGLIASVLAQQPDIILEVRSFADAELHTSRFRDSWDMTAERSASVVRMLVKDFGVPGMQIKAAGYGAYHTQYDNQTLEGKMMNRRTDLVFRLREDLAHRIMTDFGQY